MRNMDLNMGYMLAPYWEFPYREYSVINGDVNEL